MSRPYQSSGGAPAPWSRPQGTQQPGARPPGGPQPGARPGLIPANPLPLWKAVVQVLLLLGVPIALLLIARPILKTFFPELGY